MTLRQKTLLLPFLLIISANVPAEQLPIKTYTIAEGLARDSINCVVQDSHGFMWFCTPEGLSRFNGYGFVNYGPDQGLPSRQVTALLETRSGVYWVATGDGLCLFNPRGSRQVLGSALSLSHGEAKGKTASPVTEPKFVVYRPDETKGLWRVTTLLEDHDGTIWCGTDHGLYRLISVNQHWTLRFLDLGIVARHSGDLNVKSMVEDRHGALWIATSTGLYRHWPDGRTEPYTTQQGLPENAVTTLLKDREGRLWVGTVKGLCRIIAEPDPGRSIVERLYTTRDGLPNDRIESLFQSRDGTLWMGISLTGLSAFDPAESPDRPDVRSYTNANGLSDKSITALTEDRDGNLWVGTESGGAMKITRHGFSTYGETDGITQTRINSILEDRAGELCIISGLFDRQFIDRFDGRRFSETVPRVPERTTFSWGWYQVTLQDHLGEWWLATANGVVRFPPVTRPEQLAHVRPKAVYTAADGLTGSEIFRLFEDSRGDIWIGTISVGPETLTRWDRATGKFHRYSPADGIPPAAPTAFHEDAAGNLWIGFYGNGLFRYRDGRFTRFDFGIERQRDNVVRGLYLDHSGRLWVATSANGLVRIDDPATENPRSVSYTTTAGLSTNTVTCITEDQWGHIYVGTGRGLDRLDPATGNIKHYTTADGLADNFINVSFRDHNGALWFGTLLGLSRLIPEPDPPVEPPSILLSGLHIAGTAQPLSDLGETDVGRLELTASQNQIQADFFSPNFRSGEVLRYQYILEGADSGWSAPTLQRSVIYGNLKPGSYSFKVRAMNVDGLTSPTPAIVSFTILPPLWARWWFLLLSLLMFSSVAFMVYRYRIRQLLALERVRTRIATDLHDDIGASLSQIAILSEVVQQQLNGAEPSVTRSLSKIASVSRELVDSMSDIVWAINPKRDRLRDLVQRMRRFASDVFTARHVTFTFHAPARDQNMKIGTDIRRQVFLIFKESVNNAVRHSGCTTSDIQFEIAQNRLTLIVSDNGRGFSTGDADEGHGLMSMRERAKEIGGTLEVTSAAGLGTTVLLRLPLEHRSFLRRGKGTT